jgi:hypothetical protein
MEEKGFITFGPVAAFIEKAKRKKVLYDCHQTLELRL